MNLIYKIYLKIKTNSSFLIPVLGFLAMVLIFVILTGGQLLSVNNLKILVRQTVIIYSLSLGMLFIFAQGSFDISAGAVIALLAIIMTIVYDWVNVLWIALLISIIIGAIIYGINIFISIKFGLITTISSLAIMFISRGIVTLAIQNTGSIISTSANLDIFRKNYVLLIIYLITITIIFVVLFNHTRLGKEVKTIGDNADAALLSGVDVNKIKIISYLVAGAMVGVASIFFLARTSTVSEKAGVGMEMDIIISLILGGMNLSGGAKSNINAAIFGSLSYVILSNGLMITGIEAIWITLVKGLIFLIIVLITVSQRKTKLIPK